MQVFVSDSSHVVYKKVLKPIFFLFPPDKVHTLLVFFGATLGRYQLCKQVMQYLWAFESTSNVKKINGIHFPNKVGLSAGFDYNADLVSILPSMGFGYHTIGTVTLEPYEGNPPPNLIRLPKSRSLLVNKGLKNIGAASIIAKLSDQKMEIPTGISIASTNKKFASEQKQIDDIIQCFRLFERSKLKHQYYELNISCPNTFGGEPFTTPVKLTRLMKRMDRLKLTRPLYVKMPIDQPPDVTLSLLKVLDKHQVQGVIFGNLTKDKTNPAVHAEDKVTWTQNKGNLSGRPTWKRSNECIALTRKHFGDRFTIIGTGGIFSGEDAYIKLQLGADLVQLITGMIYEGPQLIGRINKYLAEKDSLPR